MSEVRSLASLERADYLCFRFVDPIDQRGFDNQRSEHVTAREAARLLGVKLQTLYAYASRGLVRSTAGPRGPARVYLRADLERLKARVDARAGHGPVAAGALRWGEPVLSTAISAIRETGPAYRGIPAVQLARDRVSFEATADLLWTGTLDARTSAWSSDGIATSVRAVRGEFADGASVLEAMLSAVPRLARMDADRFGASREAEWARARRIVRVLAAAVGCARGEGVARDAARQPSVASSLAVAFGVSPRVARDVIDRTLVLAADHELNASTFAARVVASTRADLYACLTGAFAALTGPLHGAASDRVEALVDEVGSPERAREVVHARAGRGDDIPGFGHRLYPAGDPRVPPLVEAVRAAPLDGRGKRELALVVAISDAMTRSRREPPNLDFGLVAVRRALGIPRGGASTLFAIGRIAGWVAHAIEQREAGYLLRPRAEYVGP